MKSARVRVSRIPSHPACTQPDAQPDTRAYTQAYIQASRTGLHTAYTQRRHATPSALSPTTPNPPKVLLYLAVAKMGEAPIDGITAVNPEGLTSATGKWAEAFKARLEGGGLTCNVRDGDDFKRAMLEKHVRRHFEDAF